MKLPTAAEVEKARDDYYTQGNTDLAGTWLGIFATLLRSMEQAGTPMTDAIAKYAYAFDYPRRMYEHARTLERLVGAIRGQNDELSRALKEIVAYGDDDAGALRYDPQVYLLINMAAEALKEKK